jgi:hypothetical protein
MSEYQARCDCGDFCGVDTEHAVRQWAESHKDQCEYLSGQDREIQIWKVVDSYE